MSMTDSNPVKSSNLNPFSAKQPRKATEVCSSQVKDTDSSSKKQQHRPSASRSSVMRLF